MTALVIIIFNFGGGDAAIFQYGGDGTGGVLIDS